MKEDCIEIYEKYASDRLCDSIISLIDKYENDNDQIFLPVCE